MSEGSSLPRSLRSRRSRERRLRSSRKRSSSGTVAFSWHILWPLQHADGFSALTHADRSPITVAAMGDEPLFIVIRKRPVSLALAIRPGIEGRKLPADLFPCRTQRAHLVT